MKNESDITPPITPEESAAQELKRSRVGLKPGDIVTEDTLMCADYDVPINMVTGRCLQCNIAHDMQSTYILKAGNPIPKHKKRVLVVDDDPDVRDAIARYFKMQDFHVIEEEDGHTAFEAFRECYPIDYVISDYCFIPGKRESSCGCVISHGVDLVREIRKLIPNQRMVILSGTAELAKRDLTDPKNEAAKDVPVLRKPIRMRDIMAALK